VTSLSARSSRAEFALCRPKCSRLWNFATRAFGLQTNGRCKAAVAARILVLGALPGFAAAQDATQRGATSRSHVGFKFVLSRLLATIALFAASLVSAHAQTNWTGTVSSDWFDFSNWDAGRPMPTESANINTVTPHSTVVGIPGAEAQNLSIGENGTGMLVVQNGGTLIDFGGGFVGNLLGGQGTVTVTGANSDWQTNGTLVVGGQGTGTLTIQDGGTVNSMGGGSIGLAAGSTGTVARAPFGTTVLAGGSMSARLARAHSRSRTAGGSSISRPTWPTSANSPARRGQ
jgi:T5SS/PEP-CTERM-associated repeat protein